MKRVIFVLACLLGAASPVRAQFDGPRVYLPIPQNTNVLSGHVVGGTANASWEAWHNLFADVDVRNSLFLLGYTRNQSMRGRSVHWQGILPLGVVNLATPLPVSTSPQFVHGIGDPSIGTTVNLFGAPGMTLAQYRRHELGVSANLGVLVTLPVGQYDETQALNLGANQWRTRVSAPLLWSIGAWVPGRRTTLEVMPAVTVFGDNADNRGVRISQKPVYAVEAHLTRDVTDDGFVSLDYSWVGGGAQTLTSNEFNVTVGEREKLDAHLLGLTLGFNVNDRLRLNVTHMQTLAPATGGAPLEGALTKVSLMWSWHPVVERYRKLGGQ